MPKTKKTAAKKLKQNTIRIRMYRVGFGDCFLLSLPVSDEGPDEYRHFVIDCGVHGQGNIGTIGLAVDDIGKVTGNKIAAVIATHSHQDHISGFSDKFSQYEIGEVWLPWCENPKDALANKWRKKQANLAAALENHFVAQAQAGATESKGESRKKSLAALVNLTSNIGAMRLLNASSRKGNDSTMADFAKLMSNAKALQLLNGGFNVGAKVSYLEAGKVIKNAAGIQGLEVRVLGPPRDPKFLSKMDPPADQEYLRLNSEGNIETANKLSPFPKKWVIDYAISNAAPPMNSKEEKSLQNRLLDASLDSLAFALDAAKNNTSLVTLFIYRGQYLLFPGDAQYGNWKYWLEEKEAEEILPQITFLKVAHHGSHNATPKGALDQMTADNFAAMVSTQSIPWDVIPRVPLMTNLSARTKQKMVRSDWIKIPGAPDPLPNSAPAQPSTNPRGFSQDGFWYDYKIPVA